MQWEMTRAICFNVGRFGNTDPKKFPRTPQKFWPMPWDKGTVKTDAKDIMEQHAKMVARRTLLEQQMKENSSFTKR